MFHFFHGYNEFHKLACSQRMGLHSSVGGALQRSAMITSSFYSYIRSSHNIHMFSIKIITLYYSRNNSKRQVVRIPWIVNFLPVSILNLSGILKSTKPAPLGTRQDKLGKHTLLYHKATPKVEIHGVLQRF